jgi:hypothetical protein
VFCNLADIVLLLQLTLQTLCCCCNLADIVLAAIILPEIYHKFTSILPTSCWAEAWQGGIKTISDFTWHAYPLLFGLSDEYHQVFTAVLLRPGSSLAISYHLLPNRF